MLSVIVVNYNTCQLTIDALKSVFKEHKSGSFEIILFDNASTDHSANIISKTFGENVNVLKSLSNLGFAGGNNIAAKLATGDYLLLLNPDTVVLNHAIDKLLVFAEENPDALIWGGKTLFGDGTLNPSSCWKRQTLWSLFCQAIGLTSLFRKSSLFNSEGMGGWNREGTRKVDIVSGCFLLIRHDLWRKLGGFHPDFFMYGEEADLCLRAVKHGARPMVTSDATIIHYGGASETIRSDKLVRLIKSKILLIRRHFTVGTVQMGVVLLASWPLTRYMAHAVLSFLGRTESMESKKVWKDVWHRRLEWWGFNKQL